MTYSTTRQNFNRSARRSISEETRENMRAIGFFLTILSALALAWDANAVASGGAITGFSGISDIWGGLDKTSFVVVQQLVLVKLGVQAWEYALGPLFSLPAAALFGVPGLIMLRRYNPGIRVRVPSALEMEMARAGLSRGGRPKRY